MPNPAPAGGGDEVGELGDGRHEVRDRHGDHGEVDEVGEDGEPRARLVAPQHEQRRQDRPDDDAEPSGAVAVGPREGPGKRSSWAIALEVSVTINVQPFRAPMPDTTASAAMNFPGQVPWVKMPWKALTNGEPLPTSAWWATSPITAADTAGTGWHLPRCHSTEARPTFDAGFFTRFAVIAAASTPMKEKSATPAAIPMPL